MFTFQRITRFAVIKTGFIQQVFKALLIMTLSAVRTKTAFMNVRVTCLAYDRVYRCELLVGSCCSDPVVVALSAIYIPVLSFQLKSRERMIKLGSLFHV